MQPGGGSKGARLAGAPDVHSGVLAAVQPELLHGLGDAWVGGVAVVVERDQRRRAPGAAATRGPPRPWRRGRGRSRRTAARRPRRAPRRPGPGTSSSRSRAARGSSAQVGLAVLADDRVVGREPPLRVGEQQRAGRPAGRGAQLDGAAAPARELAAARRRPPAAGRARERPVVPEPRARAASPGPGTPRRAAAGRAWRAAGARAGGAASRREAIVRAMCGPSTRTIHAGVPARRAGRPAAAGPVLAAPYHLRGDEDAAAYGYGRDGNPSWTHLERALGELDGGEGSVFASGMAAVTAVLFSSLRAGDVLVACGDGYPGIRGLARERLAPLGVETRLVAYRHGRARRGRRWRRARVGRDALEPAAGRRRHRRRRRGGRTPPARSWRSTTRSARRSASSRWRSGPTSRCSRAPRACAGTPTCCSARSPSPGPSGPRRCGAGARQSGAIAGGFEAWLAHRSLATLGMRLERSSANAAAVAALLRARDDVGEVVPPGRRRRRWRSLGRSSASRSGPPSARSASSAPARWWRRPRASAACTRPPSAAAAGAPTTSTRASSASRRAARTPTDLLADVAAALDAAA